MVHIQHDSWAILKAALLLSVMVHGLIMLALSLRSEPRPEELRVVGEVRLVDRVVLPPEIRISRPRLRAPDPPPQDRPLAERLSSGGGTPAPAPAPRSPRQGPPSKNLRLDLPRVPTRSAPDPNSNMLRDESQTGSDRGAPLSTGDPNGTGGDGTGGNGTGGNGTGGSGGGWGGGNDGGAPGAPMNAEQRLRLGCIRCGECHAYDASGAEIPKAEQPLPRNLYNLTDLGWDVGGGGWPVDPKYGTDYLHALYEFEVEADGRVSKVRVLRSSSDPKEREAVNLFAAMHQWTPPGKKLLIRTDYRIYRPPATK